MTGDVEAVTQFAGVRFAPDSVSEVDAAQVMIHVPRAEVRRMYDIGREIH